MSDMILEGTILIDDADKKAIDKYFSDMEKGMAVIFKRYDNKLDEDGFKASVQKLSDGLRSNKFPFKIVYEVRGKDALGWYQKEDNEIVVVIGRMARWIVNDDGEYVCLAIHWDKVKEMFMHEFVHYIQQVYRTEKSGDYTLPDDWNDDNKYFKRGWERQAHGIEYREKVQNVLKSKNPDEILKFLKKSGLEATARLNDLKKKDYASWKAIMKQAVMNVVGDMDK